jgi:hypothetical protein
MAESAVLVQWGYEGIDDWGCRTIAGIVFAPTQPEADKLAASQFPEFTDLRCCNCMIDNIPRTMALRMRKVLPAELRLALDRTLSPEISCTALG